MKDTQLLAERQLEVKGRGAFLSSFVASGSNCSPWCGQELGRFGAVWGALGWCCGARWLSVTIWGVLGRSGTFWGALGRSGVLWGVLGRSGALWGVLGHSGVYSGTECVVYTALPASLVSLYWFLQYILGVLLNRGAKPTVRQSVWYMQHFRHQSSFCIVFYNTFRGAPK